MFQDDKARETLEDFSCRSEVPVEGEAALCSRVGCRLAFEQEYWWLLYRLYPTSPVSNLCDVYQLHGALNRPCLEGALTELVRRHEILRTTFHESDGRPLQQVSPDISVNIVQKDLGLYPRLEREALVSKLLREEARRPFNLGTGPLFRCMLLSVGPQTHLLVLNLHRIVYDEHSRHLLLSELTHLYGWFSNYQLVVSPELPIQYADFAERQRQWLGGSKGEEITASWRAQLEGAPESLALLTQRNGPKCSQSPRATHEFQLVDGLVDRLRQLSRDESVTLFVTLLAGFQILLSRYSQQEDLCVGTPIDNRVWPDTKGLIGCFTNILVLRARLEANPSFSTFVRQTGELVATTSDRQHFPYELLVRALAKDSSVNATPFAHAVFGLQNPALDREWAGGLHVNPLSLASGMDRFDLSLILQEYGQNGLVKGCFHFDPELFDPETIRRMANSYLRLLLAAVEDPGCPVQKLPLLDERERRIVIEEWNTTEPAYPLEGDVASLLEKAVESHSGRLALAGPDGKMNYGELNARSNQLAHWLQEQGIDGGSMVAIVMERSVAMIVCMVGVIKAGSAYLPIDPAYPKDRIRYALQESRVAQVITQGHLLSLCSDTGTKAFCLNDWDCLAGMANTNLRTKPSQRDTAYVIYTSGSTGRPKGVAVSHRSLLNLVLWHQSTYKVGPADRASQIASPGFDACVWEIWPYLTCGAALLVVDEETKLLPDKLREWLVRQEITLSFLPTPLAESLLREEWPVTNALRAIFVGGDRLTRRPLATNAFRVINHYGPTEATVVTTAGEVATDDEWGRLPDIGKPIANYKVYVLDRYCKPVPIGVPGELYIGGEGVALGYVNSPDVENQRFIENPWGKGRLYRSGDVVRFRNDGRLEFIGRGDDQLKIRGYRIELGEIKSVLEQQPEIEQAAVIAESRAGDAVIVAYIVAQKGIDPDVDILMSALRTKLPHYMLPHTFVSVPSLPLTPHGKLDRRKLASVQGRKLARKQADALGPLEESLVQIFETVLGVEGVGNSDNFFELGGNSLLAMRAVAEARRRGLQLMVRELFRQPDIKSLAPLVKVVHAEGRHDRIETGSCWPTTPIQRWLFDHNFVAPHWCNTALICNVAGGVDPERLRDAVRGVMAKHPALRLQFRHLHGEWLQYIDEEEDVSVFQIFDLSKFKQEGQPAEVQSISEHLHKSFSFARGRLIRFAWLDLGRQGIRLLVVAHHLISDLMSLHIVLEDLSSLYEPLLEVAAPGGRDNSDDADFTEWASRINGDGVQRALATQHYWRPTTPATVPVDFPTGEYVMSSVDFVHAILTPDESLAIVASARRRHRTSLEVVLIWAVASCLTRWQRRNSVAINIVGHGRNTPWPDLNLSRTVGWLNVHYPLVVDLPPDLQPPEAISLVANQLDQVPDYGIGYGVLRYIHNRAPHRQPVELQDEPEAGINYLGDFDTLFNNNKLFRLSKEPTGLGMDPRERSRFRLGIFCYLVDKSINVDWMFSSNLHSRNTIEKLAADVTANMRRSIITHDSANIYYRL